LVKAPLGIRPHDNGVIKNEDKSDVKHPIELTAAGYNSILSKLNLIFSISTACFPLIMLVMVMVIGRIGTGTTA
jgi:hypothetical protein